MKYTWYTYGVLCYFPLYILTVPDLALLGFDYFPSTYYLLIIAIPDSALLHVQ